MDAIKSELFAEAAFPEKALGRTCKHALRPSCCVMKCERSSHYPEGNNHQNPSDDWYGALNCVVEGKAQRELVTQRNVCRSVWSERGEEER